MRSDDYTGLKQATYTTTGWTVKNLSSVITAANYWRLYLGNQSLRTVWLTLSKPVSGSPSAPVSDGFYNADGEVYSLCFDPSDQQIAFRAIQPGPAATRWAWTSPPDVPSTDQSRLRGLPGRDGPRRAATAATAATGARVGP